MEEAPMSNELETQLRDLKARLEILEFDNRRLKDVEEIRMLRMRYHESINERASHRIPDMFTDDGEFDFGFMSRGNNIKDYFTNATQRSQFFKQFSHSHTVEVTGDTAKGSSYQEAMAVFNGRAFKVAGRYDDEYRRTSKGWKFRKMCFEPFLMMPSAEQDLAHPEKRQVDPYKGFMERDASGNLIVPAARQ
jgi:hypothetical protein